MGFYFRFKYVSILLEIFAIFGRDKIVLFKIGVSYEHQVRQMDTQYGREYWHD